MAVAMASPKMMTALAGAVGTISSSPNRVRMEAAQANCARQAADCGSGPALRTCSHRTAQSGRTSREACGVAARASVFAEGHANTGSIGQNNCLNKAAAQGLDHGGRSSPLVTQYAVDTAQPCPEADDAMHPSSGGGRWDHVGEFSGSAGLAACAAPPFLASLERSYVTQAAVGRVECNSKGCRPVLDDRAPLAERGSGGWPCVDAQRGGGPSAACGAASRQIHRRDARSLFSLEIAPLLDSTRTEREFANRWFEAAIAEAPFDARLLSAYAKFAWKELKDVEKAEHLYRRAVDEAPNNAEALAGYALFLWEHEADN